MKNSKDVNCRVCGKATERSGYLYRCKKKTCAAAHWDRSAVLREDLKDKTVLERVLEDAGVPIYGSEQESGHVYVLRLRGEPNAVYVGETGLHPYHRYLNHLRGHKASKWVTKSATALVKFEGPMSRERAKNRERTLAGHLRRKGMTVRGGH